MTWSSGGGSYYYSNSRSYGFNPSQINFGYTYDHMRRKYTDSFGNVFTEEYFERLPDNQKVTMEFKIEGVGVFRVKLMPATVDSFKQYIRWQHQDAPRYTTQPDWEDIFRNFRQAADDFGNIFNGMPKSPPPPKQEAPRPKGKSYPSLLHELCDLAGVEYSPTIDRKKTLRRAQRNHHPDVGGSHTKWLRVDYIQRTLKIN